MTIGWVEEFVREGEVVDGFKDRPDRPLVGMSSLFLTAGISILVTSLAWKRWVH